MYGSSGGCAITAFADLRCCGRYHGLCLRTCRWDMESHWQEASCTTAQVIVPVNMPLSRLCLTEMGQASQPLCLRARSWDLESCNTALYGYICEVPVTWFPCYPPPSPSPPPPSPPDAPLPPAPPSCERAAATVTVHCAHRHSRHSRIRSCCTCSGVVTSLAAWPG